MKKPLSYKQLLSAELQKLYSFLDDKRLDYSNELKAILPHVYSFASNFMFDRLYIDKTVIDSENSITFNFYYGDKWLSDISIYLYCDKDDTYPSGIHLSESEKIFMGDLDDVVNRFEAYYNNPNEKTQERSS